MVAGAGLSPPPVASAVPALRVQGLQLLRGARRVLQLQALELLQGQRLALVGPSGVGKSSLLHALLGLLPLQAGSVQWFGKPCSSEADFAAVRREVGLLFQASEDQLLCPRVIDDVCFGPLNLGWPEAEALAAAQAQLTALGITHLAQRAVRELSGGEARLVALAGLLAMRPRVLLLDEPTTGLDPQAEERLLAHLDALQQTLLLTSHDESVIERLGARRWPLQPAP